MNKNKMLQGLGISDNDEKLLFSKIFDQCVFAEKKREPQFTQFIDVARCNTFEKAFSNYENIIVKSFGGYCEVERKMLGFFPKSYCDNEIEIENSEFPIVLLMISRRHKKFGQENLSHRDYLGSILGLGIGREKIGDIIVHEDEAVCFIHESMSDYIIFNLEKISKTYVKVELLEEYDEIIPKMLEKKIENKNTTVSSLRLDTVLSKVFSLSRSKAQELIKREKVFVNWRIVTNVSLEISENMMISARGFGRFRVGTIGGLNKKNKIALEINLYI